MKILARVVTAWFLAVFPAALLGQSTEKFEATVSFEPDHSEPVLVSLACDGGIPLEQSFQAVEGSSVTFTVKEFSPDYTCVLQQEPVKGYDTAYAANGEPSSDACTFVGDKLVTDNTCAITNTWSGHYWTSFEVHVSFTDDNPMEVEVEVSCVGEASVVAVGDALASASSPAFFEVTWLASVPATCTANQVSVPDGYNRSEGDCLAVPMTRDPVPECVLRNYQRSVSVDVGVAFLDGNPSPVPVKLTCDEGMVVISDEMASHDGDALFRVREFPYSGTVCMALADLPGGYELSDSTCSDLAVAPDAHVTCDILSAPVTPLLPDPTAITGSWYSPDSSGEGFMLHSVNDDLAVGYFYGYDNDGESLWLIGVSDGPFEWGEPAVFEAQYATGGSFTKFDPENIVRTDWGSFAFTQWDCDRATVHMLGEHGAKTTHLIRLAATSGMACSGAGVQLPTDAVTGSWYEKATSGQGFSVHKVAVDHGVVYFYGYDDQGDNLWLIGDWHTEWAFGDELLLEMLLATGGTFDYIDPDQILREPWGTLQLRFDDCNRGWARLEGVDGIQEIDITLLAGSLGMACRPSAE